MSLHRYNSNKTYENNDINHENNSKYEKLEVQHKNKGTKQGIIKINYKDEQLKFTSIIKQTTRAAN